jgi:hypothetical protein
MKDSGNIERGDRSKHPVRLLSVEGGSIYLSCSTDTIEELIGLGALPVVRLGVPPHPGKKDRRKRYVDRNDLDELIESRKERIGGST